MTMQWILGWWNLVFLVPFGLALLYLAMYTVSGVTFGEADADAEAGVDADADVDADVDADAHVDVDADADVDADVDVDADAEQDVHHPHHGHAAGGARAGVGLGDAMALLGVGRVPLSLVLMILLLAWGFIGFVANQFLRELMPREWMIPLVSLPLAAVGAVAATGLTTRTLARLMPVDESYARRREHLLGEVGEAVFPIDERFGMVAVRDDRGNLFQVACRVEPGRPPIAKGAKVLLVAHDANRNVFHVTPDDGGVLARG
jgi:membrane protein implicated in regulation of membrane protease activity